MQEHGIIGSMDKYHVWHHLGQHAWRQKAKIRNYLPNLGKQATNLNLKAQKPKLFN